MPHLGAGGDCSQVSDEDMAATGQWRALEDGEYRFKITETAYKETAKGDGMCLHVTVRCVEPSHTRSHWREFLTLEHPNPETVKIARAKLKQIAVAVGHPNPDYIEQSEDLHEIPFIAVVSREQADDPKYGDVDGYQNRVVAYKPINSGPGTHASEPQRSSGPEPPPPNDMDIPF